MNDETFVKKATKLIHKIRLDYEMCEDIEGDAKALYLLIHNYLELKKMEKENEDQ